MSGDLQREEKALLYYCYESEQFGEGKERPGNPSFDASHSRLWSFGRTCIVLRTVKRKTVPRPSGSRSGAFFSKLAKTDD